MRGEMAQEVAFKLAFLRTMAPLMTEPDLDMFKNLCEVFQKGEAIMLAHLVQLDHMYKKFDKPAGPERI